MAGLYFEELTVGRTFDHAWTRTVTEMDNVLFSSLTMNVQPLHLDEEFAAKTEFGQRIVNSIFTLGLVIGISVGDTTLGTTVANLGMTEAVRLPTQSLGAERVPLLEAARRLGVSVIASATLMQSQLTRSLPDQVHAAFPGFKTDARRAIAFTQSLPVAAALVGMKSRAHLEENLAAPDLS
jgi:hypothetical protein